MKATELRIGNYLYYKNTNDLAIVELIHKKHFDCRDEYGSFSPNGNYEPIPLTEEWLLKLGFDKKFSKDKFTIIPNGKLDYEKGRTYFNAWTILEHQPEYVHQLQNLYFALTGEELSYEK